MVGRTLVVHGTNLLVRGFHTLAPDRVSRAGEPTNALFAAASALHRALAFRQPDRAVAVLDAHANRNGQWPELLARQHPHFEGLLKAHGFHVAAADEAEHVVAAYTRSALEMGDDVIVVGSDKRLAQLVSERVWWYDAYKDVRYTPDMVRKRFEVPPDQVSDWLALVGDGDQLPGVRGIGKKGATALLAHFTTIEEALSNADDIAGRTGKALRAARQEVPQELRRARLARDHPLPVPLTELQYRPPSADALQTLYAELDFLELLSVTESTASVNAVLCRDHTQLEAFISASKPPVALYAVTEDPSPARGALVGLALAAAGSEPLYVPLGTDEDAGMLAALRPVLESTTIAKVGHDVRGALVAFARRQIRVTNVIGDTACASHLRDPSNLAPHDLSDVSRHILRRPLPDPEKLRGVGRSLKAWSQLDAQQVGDFAAAMAVATLDAHLALAPETDERLLREYLDLSHTLVGMELRGIACDRETLTRSGADFETIREQLEKEIYELAEGEFNLGSTKQLGNVLFEKLGLPIFKRTKTGWSTATEALERIENAHPIVSLVIRWRRLRRLTDTWVTALSAAIDDDGRVRSTFYPARSFSGRLVNANPDLGRVPGRTPEMKRIRRAFVAPPGRILISVDYRQLGLYVLAHLTQDPALIEPLRNDADMHTLTASVVLDKPIQEISIDDRQTGKVVNFATFAGQGASALAFQLGISASEAKEVIARFDRRYSVVRSFQDEQLRLAKERGYIQTIAGRRWPIGELLSPDPMMRSYAERLARRATHEGSVADVSRRGLLHADHALRQAKLDAFPLLQVHDEVLFEAAEGQLHPVAERAAEAMRDAFRLEVPLRVGVKVGPTWADLEPLVSDG